MFQKKTGSETNLWMRGGYHVFSRIFCASHYQKILGNLRCFRNVLALKTFMDTKGKSRFSVDLFLSRITEIFHWKLFVVSEKNGIGGNIWTRQGASQFSVKFVFVSFYRKISLRTFHCFRRTFFHRKLFRDWLGKSVFRRTSFFVLPYRKNSMGTARCSKKLLVAKILWMREGGFTFFLSILFCLSLSKTFIGNSSVFQKKSGSDKFVWMREWDITFFRRNFFVSHYRKTSRGTLRRLGKTLTVTMYYGCDGDISFLQGNFFSLTLAKNFTGNCS